MNIDYLRHMDFYNPYDDNKKVTIIGAGSVGSFTALGLAMLGKREITICDYDNVESHNLPNQAFIMPERKNNMYKVELLKETINKFTNRCKVRILIGRDTDYFRYVNSGDLETPDVIISAVDTIEGRRSIYENALSMANFLIDPHIGGEHIYVRVLKVPDDEDRNDYVKFLNEHSNVKELPCSGRVVVDVSFFVAGIIISLYRKIVKNEIYPKLVMANSKTLEMISFQSNIT